jgi:hypothetical protein
MASQIVYLSKEVFKPLIKRLEVCEEIVATLERALPNDRDKVKKVEKETLEQLKKFMALMIKEIGPKHVVHLVVTEMLKLDEERERIFSRSSASQEAQLAKSIHELLEVMASNQNSKDKKYKVS